MHLQPSSRQGELIALARRLGCERFAPRADRHDRAASFPFDDYADLRAEGLLGLCVPERSRRRGSGKRGAHKPTGPAPTGFATDSTLEGRTTISGGGTDGSNPLWPSDMSALHTSLSGSTPLAPFGRRASPPMLSTSASKVLPAPSAVATGQRGIPPPPNQQRCGWPGRRGRHAPFH
jgi:hypothetical protein